MEGLRSGQDGDAPLFNAFEPVALAAFPGLEEAWRALGEAVEPYAGRPHLSGTGPAIYAFVPGKPEGEEAANTLKRKGLRAYLVATINPDPDGEGTGTS